MSRARALLVLARATQSYGCDGGLLCISISISRQNLNLSPVDVDSGHLQYQYRSSVRSVGRSEVRRGRVLRICPWCVRSSFMGMVGRNWNWGLGLLAILIPYIFIPNANVFVFRFCLRRRKQQQVLACVRR
jgi:hypothetical protein